MFTFSFLRVPFSWKFLKIGSVIVYSFVKNFPNLQVGWPSPFPPTPQNRKSVYIHSNLQIGCVTFCSRLYLSILFFLNCIICNLKYTFNELQWLTLSDTSNSLFDWGPRNLTDPHPATKVKLPENFDLVIVSRPVTI